jgi:hypothetical protein
VELPNDDLDTAPLVWDIMAKGRLPALASFSADFYPESVRGWGDGYGARKVGRRLRRAFEAVAGTLRRLTLRAGSGYQEDELPAGAAYELGAAIGKLRRLRYLDLNLFRHGRQYSALGRGMAASGGCPELFEVVVGGVTEAVDWLTFEPSMIGPSVRGLRISACTTDDEALLLCCGFVERGYRCRLEMDLTSDCGSRLSEDFRLCMRAILQCNSGLNALFE